MALIDMKRFKIYEHPSGEIQAVKIGWCWPAFFFSSFWALFSKMWALAVSLIVILFGLGMLLGYLNLGAGADTFINVISIFINLIFGRHGNSWRGKNLRSRGFELLETVSSDNKDDAIAVYLNDTNAEEA